MSDDGSLHEGPDAEVAEVEDLPVGERPEAYLRVERALQERLGLGGP